MKEYIKQLLTDEELTDEEKQYELSDLLHDRMMFHKFDECKVLVEAGAKLHNFFIDNIFGDPKICRFVIENKLADINLKDEEGMNFYAYAERAYYVTGKPRYKQVRDYLAKQGAEKLAFSNEEKEFLKHKFEEKCEFVKKVKSGEAEKPSGWEYCMIELDVKFGLIDYSERPTNNATKEKDRDK